LTFIDSIYLLTLLNDRDQYHDKAKKIELKVRKMKKIMSTIILTETLNSLNCFWRKNWEKDIGFN
jgi:hypothetical protein